MSTTTAFYRNYTTIISPTASFFTERQASFWFYFG
jgi:hypothetical protein